MNDLVFDMIRMVGRTTSVDLVNRLRGIVDRESVYQRLSELYGDQKIRAEVTYVANSRSRVEWVTA